MAKFNCAEVLEMALQIERNGGRFYRRAAAEAANAEVRDALLELAEMEEDHEELFAELKEKVSGSEAPEVAYDPQGESALYLRAAADTHIFNVHRQDPAQLGAGQSAEEVLRTALQFEKDSVVFFLGLQEMVPEGLGKERVAELVREEMRHITTLSARLEGLAGD
jgi:rubrerythrin